MRCARLKARLVEQDESDRGVRALLNLGHTVGHAIEAASLAASAPHGAAALRHGEAVALGLVAAVRVSVKMRLCDPSLAERLQRVLVAQGLAAQLDPWLRDDAVRGYLAADKKRSGHKVRFVALGDVGVPKPVWLFPDEIWHILKLPEKRWYDGSGGFV